MDHRLSKQIEVLNLFKENPSTDKGRFLILIALKL
jgi:hypothetical protein